MNLPKSQKLASIVRDVFGNSTSDEIEMLCNLLNQGLVSEETSQTVLLNHWRQVSLPEDRNKVSEFFGDPWFGMD